VLIPSRYIKNGSVRKVNCWPENGDCISGFMIYNGTFYYFDQSDIEVFLREYPADRHGWFFDRTKDRYIAEKTSCGICVSPAFVKKHFIETDL